MVFIIKFPRWRLKFIREKFDPGKTVMFARLILKFALLSICQQFAPRCWKSGIPNLTFPKKCEEKISA